MQLQDEEILLAGERLDKVGRFFRRRTTTGEQQCYPKRGFKGLEGLEESCDAINDPYKECVGSKTNYGLGKDYCNRHHLKIDSAYNCIHKKALIDGKKVNVCDWRHMPRIG